MGKSECGLSSASDKARANRSQPRSEHSESARILPRPRPTQPQSPVPAQLILDPGLTGDTEQRNYLKNPFIEQNRNSKHEEMEKKAIFGDICV